MSTDFWGVENNSLVRRTVDEVRENIKKSKFNMLLEEVDGRYRVEVDPKEFSNLLSLKGLDPDGGKNYFWLGTCVISGEWFIPATFFTPANDHLVGLTRFGRNNTDIGEVVVKEVYGCSDSVCEYDETSRLVEVGLLDPSSLEDEEEEAA